MLERSEPTDRIQLVVASSLASLNVDLTKGGVIAVTVPSDTATGVGASKQSTMAQSRGVARIIARLDRDIDIQSHVGVDGMELWASS